MTPDSGIESTSSSPDSPTRSLEPEIVTDDLDKQFRDDDDLGATALDTGDTAGGLCATDQAGDDLVEADDCGEAVTDTTPAPVASRSSVLYSVTATALHVLADSRKRPSPERFLAHSDSDALTVTNEAYSARVWLEELEQRSRTETFKGKS